MKQRLMALSLFTLGGCRATSVAVVSPSTESVPPSIVTVMRTLAPFDTTGLRARVGHLSVVVRSVQSPLLSLGGANVRGSRVDGDSAKHALRQARVDTLGLAHIDSLPAGYWRLEGRRIGYQPFSTVVRSIPGCRTTIELYLADEIYCLSHSDCTAFFWEQLQKATPPRAVITTCIPALLTVHDCCVRRNLTRTTIREDLVDHVRLDDRRDDAHRRLHDARVRLMFWQ